MFNEYGNLATDYLWMPRITKTLYGKSNDLTPKFNNSIIAILAETTNVNPSNIAGYLTQLADTQLGIGEINQRWALPNKLLKVVIFPSIINYRLRLTLATPVGHCQVRVWEASPKN